MIYLICHPNLGCYSHNSMTVKDEYKHWLTVTDLLVFVSSIPVEVVCSTSVKKIEASSQGRIETYTGYP